MTNRRAERGLGGREPGIPAKGYDMIVARVALAARVGVSGQTCRGVEVRETSPFDVTSRQLALLGVRARVVSVLGWKRRIRMGENAVLKS